MKLQQLRYLCAIVDHDLNLSEAANTLCRSQPAVSRFIKILEDELGTSLFVRSGKRLVSLTESGNAIQEIARRMLSDEAAIRKIGREFVGGDEGEFVIATTHTNAQYGLAKAISRFIALYPRVHVTIKEGGAPEIASWVSDGQADLSVGAEPEQAPSGVLFLPCYNLDRLLLAKPDHPIFDVEDISLSEIAKHPIVSYHTLSERMWKVFSQAGLRPNIVLSAENADTMKTYLKLGVGIGVAPHIVFNPRADEGIRALPIGHLFVPTQVCIGISIHNYMRSYVYDFITLLSPELKRRDIVLTIEKVRVRANY